jgi:hypothetical protein
MATRWWFRWACDPRRSGFVGLKSHAAKLLGHRLQSAAAARMLAFPLFAGALHVKPTICGVKVAVTLLATWALISTFIVGSLTLSFSNPSSDSVHRLPAVRRADLAD